MPVLTTHNIKEIIIMGNLVIKNDSFIQSMHNDIQCLSLDTATRPCDRCWFTSKQIQDWADMDRKTLNRRLDKLASVGRIVGLKADETADNIIDIDNDDQTNDVVDTKSTKASKIGSGSNLGQTLNADIQLAFIEDSCGVPHEMKIYNLNVLNHLAMVELDNEKLNTIANKFSDILSEVETTGQYNTQPIVPQTYLEALKALVASEEEKEQLKLTNETLTTELTNVCEQRDKAIRERGYINDKRLATIMSHEGVRARKINKLENELSDTIEKLDRANVDNDILKAQLEIAKSSMLTNKRVCEILRDRFEISYADRTLKSKTSKALQSIANEFCENIIYDKQFVDGVLRKVPYYTQRTVDILTQRLEYDCAYLRQF